MAAKPIKIFTKLTGALSSELPSCCLLATKTNFYIFTKLKNFLQKLTRPFEMLHNFSFNYIVCFNTSSLVQNVSHVAVMMLKTNFCKPEICPTLLKLWSTIKSDQQVFLIVRDQQSVLSAMNKCQSVSSQNQILQY